MTESIVVERASKRFTMQYTRTIKQMSIAALRGQKLSDSFLAVNDVSFKVEQGESIGLMGLNGSGKSTLLKLISGVMRPDHGSVLTRGRIAGLIAAGAGFHPQLTGRENLFLNAAILGMSEAETKRKFDQIVDFADVGKFLETPVGHYSSGMSARTPTLMRAMAAVAGTPPKKGMTMLPTPCAINSWLALSFVPVMRPATVPASRLSIAPSAAIAAAGTARSPRLPGSIAPRSSRSSSRMVRGIAPIVCTSQPIAQASAVASKIPARAAGQRDVSFRRGSKSMVAATMAAHSTAWMLMGGSPWVK